MRIMNIKNLQRAHQLAKELKELEMCRSLLQGGGTVKVYGNGDTWEVVNSKTAKDALLDGINGRIEDINKEVESL